MTDELIPPGGDASDEKKKRKQAEKARGVWISFAGRIVAQIVGAVASVVLGIMVLQRYQASPASAPATAPAASDAPAPRAATTRRPGQAAIAVLPFANLAGKPDQEYFVDGMTEALVAGLAKVDGLRVISRTSTTRYKTEHPSIPEIARALGVDLVVEGSVLQAGDQVRITAQLIDGGTDEHLWAESYTRTVKDVIALQDTVATAIATAINGTVSRRPGSRPATDHLVDAATYDLYLRGRHAWNARSPEGMTTALAFFQKAVDQDPAFALAHVGLADTYALMRSPSTAPADGSGNMAKAKAAAIRALDLDNSLAEAHTALGGVLFFGERDLRDAEMKFRRAIELNPNYPVVHEWLGLLLAEQGRHDEALRHAEIAVGLDPFETTMYQARGVVQYNARRYADAAASERRALELSPALPLAPAILVKALVLDGKAAEALPLCPDTMAASTVDLRIACVVAAARANRAEQSRRWRAAIETMRPTPGAALAQIDAALGRLDVAVPRLEALAARGSLPPVLGFDPLFDELRQDPRWTALAARRGAPGTSSR